MFNEVLLTPYTPPAFPNQEQPPPLPPDLIDGTEHYEVKKFLIADVAESGENKEGPPKVSQTILSNRKDMDQSQTAGCKRTIWLLMN